MCICRIIQSLPNSVGGVGSVGAWVVWVKLWRGPVKFWCGSKKWDGWCGRNFGVGSVGP